MCILSVAGSGCSMRGSYLYLTFTREVRFIPREVYVALCVFQNLTSFILFIVLIAVSLWYLSEIWKASSVKCIFHSCLELGIVSYAFVILQNLAGDRQVLVDQTY